MSDRIALCVDELTWQNPDLIGLGGEILDSQAWLDVYSHGLDARDALAGDADVGEAWVVSAEDVEPINLAASLKADRPDLHVVLVEFDGCGSLYSRAHSASIDEVVERTDFIRRYSERKGRLSRVFREEDPMRPQSLEAIPISSGDPVGGMPVSKTVYLAEPQEKKAGEGAGPSVPAATAMPVSEGRLAGGVSVASASGLPGSQETLEPAREIVLAAPDRQPRHATVQTAVSASAFLLPVVSGSGGAGKSAVSVVAAFAAQRLGYKTLLLDYDLQFGDVAWLAGAESPLRIDEAIAYPDKLVAAAAESGGLTVVAAPERLEESEVVARSLPDLLETIDGVFDVAIANTGSAWADQHAALLERCNAAVFLVDQRASSVRACRHALELCNRCSIATGPFRYAVNRCMKGAPLSSMDVSSALGGVPVFELREGGRDVEDYLSGGAVDELIDARNDFCVSVQALVEKLLPDGEARARAAGLPAEVKRPVRKKGRHGSRKRKWGSS